MTNKNKKIVGIDLGTTNSVIAVLEGANPVVIPNAEGARTTPSIVAYTNKGETLVGQIAKRQSIVNSENTFYSIKRFIGSSYNEVKSEIDLVPYRVLPADNGKVEVYSTNVNKYFSPEEISSVILKKLVYDASKYLKETISEAIITVPAYFNDSQRLATKDAGSIAGLNVLRILNEPTAAALAYGLNKKKNEIVLIFDLGGGTFDVSLLEVGNEVFEVLATSGNTHLGGDNFDQKIANSIIDEFEALEGIDLRDEKQALQRIIEAAEKAKIELSTLQTTKINLPFICVKDNTPKHIDIDLDRSKFETLCRYLLHLCEGPVLTVLRDAKISKTEIDEVILVGGSTRIPAVRNVIKNLIGKELNESVNPDEVVALGAAVQAGILAGEITDLILLDVTPLSLGVETLGGLMTTIISKNSSIPVKQSEIFSTANDSQTLVEIHVLQGERPLAKDNKSLGTFQLQGIPIAPRGIPRIRVTFQLDVNGILSVTALEEQTGKEQSIQIEGASTLTREDVAKMIKDAEDNAIIDKNKKTLININYEIDNLLFKMEKLLNNKFINRDTNIRTYFKELYKAIKFSYNKSELMKNIENIMNQLKYISNVLSKNVIFR